MPDHSVKGLFEDRKGRIWVCTKKGLSCRYKGVFTNYGTQDGLPTDNVKFVVEGDDGNLWVGTSTGLVRFDGVKTFNTFTSRKYGLISNNWYNGFKDTKGTLWLGSPQGLMNFTPPLAKPNLVPPPVHITGVSVMGNEMPVSDFLRTAYSRNYIRLQFKGLCYRAPESVVYKYRLQDVDSRWQETGDDSISYYFPSGSYRFQVKAVNNDGIESTTPAAFAFEVLPAFWQTWWFKVLAQAAALAVILFLVLWFNKRRREKAEFDSQTRQLVMSQRMELIGTLATGTIHDLKNLLGIIMGYSQIIKQAFAEDDDNYRNAEVIKETTGTAVQMTRQILAFSRAGAAELEEVNLVELLMEILDLLKITCPPGIDIRLQVPDNSIPFAIHPARFQQVVMNLYQNAIHAMSTKGTLTAGISRRGNDILITISDTGTGIEEKVQGQIFQPLYTTKEKHKGTGLGLFVVKHIVEENNGKVTVISEPGKGSTFEIRFPATVTS
ncbi:MAG: GHKL domain-containing protein [bacterium]|nr:GHKL domain-containing protein [bacterium]